MAATLSRGALRPRDVAAALLGNRRGCGKFSIFTHMSCPMSPPLLSTGCAAPIVVPGAIAATCAASVTNIPAEVADAPVGAT